jgi:hypothetical protein
MTRPLGASGHETARPALAWAPLLGVAAARLAVPLLSTGLAPIGYTADELYYLACADHPAWGYVDHPPFSVAVLAAVRGVLGDSLLALRIVPALCEALAVLVTASLARELGGGRSAQVVAALAMAVAPMALAIGLPYSMNPLEHLLWPLAALVLARLQNGASAREWLVLGLLLGVALLNKLSTLWLGVGLAVGLLASPARFWLGTRWPWLAGALALACLAPHVAWQVANEWPTLEFVRNNATGREGIDAAVVMGSPAAFAASQLVAMGVFASPLWLLGLVQLFRAPAHRTHRVLGWMFAVTFALVALSGRCSVYYLVGAFPIVFAAGGVAVEQLARRRLLDAAAGGDLVVIDDRLLAPHVADQRRALRLLGVVQAALVDHRHGQPQPLGEVPGDLAGAGIGGHHDVVGQALLLEVPLQDRRRQQLVGGLAEEPQDLRGVQGHGQHAVGPGAFQQVSHQPGGDRDARLVFLVAARIGKVRQHRRDSRCRRKFQGVYQDQQLDDVIGQGRRGRLDDEHVAAPDVLLDLHLDVFVGEPDDFAPPQGHARLAGDGSGQGRVTAAGKDLQGSTHGRTGLTRVPRANAQVALRRG